MLLSFWTGLLLILLLGIAMIPLFAWIAKLMKKQAAGGGVIGFFLGFAIVVVLFVMSSSLYVGNGNDECTSYFVYGTPEYEMANGDKIKIEMESGELMVINDSQDTLVLEEVKYGSIFRGGTKWLEPGEVKTVEGGRIHYFFDNEPPDEINTKSDDGKEVRWWLRNKR